MFRSQSTRYWKVKSDWLFILTQTQDIVTLKMVKNTITLRRQDKGVRKEDKTTTLYERSRASARRKGDWHKLCSQTDTTDITQWIKYSPSKLVWFVSRQYKQVNGPAIAIKLQPLHKVMDVSMTAELKDNKESPAFFAVFKSCLKRYWWLSPGHTLELKQRRFFSPTSFFPQTLSLKTPKYLSVKTENWLLT